MSTTTRSKRGRYLALAALTAGVSWFTTGQAMAGEDATTAVCGQQGGSETVLTDLAPADGVLSITDAAGAAAGRGMPALPGRAVAPARTLPGAQPGSLTAPTRPEAASAVSGGTVPAKSLIPLGDAFSAGPSAVPLLAITPVKPSVTDAVCRPLTAQTSQSRPRPQDGTQTVPGARPDNEQPKANPPGRPMTGADTQTADRSARGHGHTPRGRTVNQATGGATAGQAQGRPHVKNPGTADSAQGARQAANGQRGTAQNGSAGRQEAQRPNRQVNADAQAATGHKRRHPQPATAAEAGSAASRRAPRIDPGRSPRVAKREGREYPKAEARGQESADRADLPAPALVRSTGAQAVADLAGRAGRKLLS